MKFLLTLGATILLTVACFSAVLFNKNSIEHKLACPNLSPGKIIFVENSSVLSMSATQELNRLILYMEMNPGCRILLKSFPKAWPKNSHSEKLTKTRLKNVMEYLCAHKMDAERLLWILDESMEEKGNTVVYQLPVSSEGEPFPKP